MKFEKLGQIISIHKGRKVTILGNDAPRSNAKRVLQIDDLRNDNLIKYTNDTTSVFVSENDLMIAWDGANAGTVGYGKQGYIGSTIAALKIKKPKDYATVFIGKFLQTQFEYLQKNCTGATIPHINRASLEKLLIPALKMSEQIKISLIITQIETLIGLRKDSIQILDEFLKSTFWKLFGDPIENEKGFSTKTIEQLVKNEKRAIKRGPFGGALKKEIFVPSGYLVYEQYHALNNDFSFERYYIDEKKFEELKGFEVVPGDIIISCSGVYLGKLAIVPPNAKKGIINQALLKISLDNNIISNDFFVFLFSHNSFRKKFFGDTRGSGIPNFPPIEHFKKFKFIYPPSELQEKFTNIILKTNEIKSYYLESLNELQHLFDTLSQKAFKGELDLSGINIEKEPTKIENMKEDEAVDIQNMSLDDHYKIPEEIQEQYGSIENHIFDWEFFFKKHFSGTPTKPITVESVESLHRAYNYERGVDFDYDEFCEVVFNELKKENSILKQEFNKETKQLQLILNEIKTS